VNDPEVETNLCFPGKEEVAKVVAEITGKQMTAMEDMVAVPRCSRIEGQVQQKQRYVGYQTCAGADLAFGGPVACHYACIGLGDCATACPFDAIVMVDGFPVVDAELCVSCGTCVRTCPKTIFELMPLKARVWVPCSTKDPGKAVKAVCGVGCISCKMCIKVCPAKAVTMKDGIIDIDHKLCMDYGPECGEICVEKCPRNIFRTFSPLKEQSQQQKEAASAA